MDRELVKIVCTSELNYSKIISLIHCTFCSSVFVRWYLLHLRYGEFEQRYVEFWFPMKKFLSLFKEQLKKSCSNYSVIFIVLYQENYCITVLFRLLFVINCYTEYFLFFLVKPTRNHDLVEERMSNRAYSRKFLKLHKNSVLYWMSARYLTKRKGG